MEESTDFIVTELLSELKEENKRKDAQIKALNKAILRIVLAALAVLLCTIISCFIYLNQYDYTSSDVLSIEKTAEGMLAIVDSDGNIIGYDEPLNAYGESYLSSDSNTN